MAWYICSHVHLGVGTALTAMLSSKEKLVWLNSLLAAALIANERAITIPSRLHYASALYTKVTILKTL